MTMGYSLAGDIGGTNTRLSLSVAGTYEPFIQINYLSAAYGSLADIIEVFLGETLIRDVTSACLALAGPVTGRIVKLTNLPWAVDGDQVARRFNIARVVLINDFVAVGHGVEALQASDLVVLQAGHVQALGERLVAGAGTGLGVAWMSWQGGAYLVSPAEAGHMDFAPTDEMQCLLLRYLQHRHEHVSYERIVSGPGLLAIYEFLRDTGLGFPSAQLLVAMAEGEAAAALSEFSQRDDEPIAGMAIELFMTVYGAFLGNLALAGLPLGGIYIAGGIAAKNTFQIQRGEFMKAFLAKGRFADLLANIPVMLVKHKDVGLLGAQLVAQRQP
jgi:glucokinase